MLASTGATDIILDRETVERTMATRPNRPLMVVDVGMPRDVDAGVGEIPAVRLLDLDDLKDYAQRSTERRRAEIGKAREILAAEVERYRDERAERLVAPLVTELRRRANEVRASELERHRAKLAALDPETVALIESITKGITNKLLHDPTVRVKQAAGTERGELLADSLTTLFDLDTPPDRDS